ncbi:MAG: hypothetical protein ACR2MM_01220, partial [Flavobacteriaceae bacterium]
TRSAYLPYAVAAVLAGVLLATVWFIKDSDNPGLDNMPLVEQPTLTDPANGPGKSNEIVPALTADEIINEDATTTPEMNIEEAVAKNDGLGLQSQESLAPKELPKIRTEVIIDAKISEVVARVKLLEDNQDSVTNAEVDALLRTAQQEILADREFLEDNNIDSASLLTGVEDELDESFRDQVFEKLNQGFIRVKTAIADRNK